MAAKMGAPPEEAHQLIENEEDGPLDLSTAKSKDGDISDDQQQMLQVLEACGLVFQQNLFALFLQSLMEPIGQSQLQTLQNLTMNTPEVLGSSLNIDTNSVSNQKESSFIIEKENTPQQNILDTSPSPPRRRTSSGKIDRRMIGKNCSRRTEANARERNRVQTLSKKFDELRIILPVEEDVKVSKLAILKVATAYINFLGGLLTEDTTVKETRRQELMLQMDHARTGKK